MNLLLVDDQASVVQGILAHVRFSDCGIDDVQWTTSPLRAMEILQETAVDILVTDIEMPFMSGLELIAQAKEICPDILCILLSSHAVFSYAQESLRLGCFSYIVQPAPYEEIEENIKKAVAAKGSLRQKIDGEKTPRYASRRQELLNIYAQKLFSVNKADVEDAKDTLNECGFHLYSTTKVCQIFLTLFASPDSSANLPSQKNMQQMITERICFLGLDCDIECLVSIQPKRQYSILLFSNGSLPISLENTQLEMFYSSVKEALSPLPVACYVSDVFYLEELYSVTATIQQNIRENIQKKSGLFFLSHNEENIELPTSLSHYISRWSMLLRSEKRFLLKNDIECYIALKILNASNQYLKLCELHQALIQLFFHFFAEKGVPVSSIFTEAYSYRDCMESYKSIDELIDMVDFLTSCSIEEKKPDKSIDYTEKAKSFILENINMPIRVKDVAEHVHLNAEYFTRMFKRETGVGIKDYITNAKIEMAKDLLANSALPISMIALEVGYLNFSHFSQLFRQIEGISPVEYRERSKH